MLQLVSGVVDILTGGVPNSFRRHNYNTIHLKQFPASWKKAGKCVKTLIDRRSMIIEYDEVIFRVRTFQLESARSVTAKLGTSVFP